MRRITEFRGTLTRRRQMLRRTLITISTCGGFTPFGMSIYHRCTKTIRIELVARVLSRINISKMVRRALIIMLPVEITCIILASPKYKHAFFSMLTLVCLLLAILGVCVYILKKNNKSISSASSILWQKLMFRSRLLIDRRLTRRQRTTSPADNFGRTSKEPTSGRFHDRVADSNNNRTAISNNFNFVEPKDFIGPFDDDVKSLHSLQIKNWRYHLTNNKF